jgi:hypothetical protein
VSLEKLIRTISQHRASPYLYHFTDKENFDTIKEHGLLSKNAMRKLCFWPARPSGNQWSWNADDKKGISDYVSLCFTQNHPMCHIAEKEGRTANPRYLKICPTVLLIDGVLLALDIANKADVALTPIRDALEGIDQEVLYSRTDWKDPEIKIRRKAVKKYEILIPNQVLQKYFKG